MEKFKVNYDISKDRKTYSVSIDYVIGRGRRKVSEPVLAFSDISSSALAETLFKAEKYALRLNKMLKDEISEFAIFPEHKMNAVRKKNINSIVTSIELNGLF